MSPSRAHQEPVWLNPPTDLLPGIAPTAFVLGRGPDVVVTVTGIAAYPVGIGFRLHLRFRSLDGPLVFTAEWPSEGLASSRVAVEAAPLRAAAAQAIPLWSG